jgi:hypothetical protein
MKEAGYGRGSEYTLDKKVRGDKFIWLTHHIDNMKQEGLSEININSTK